MTMDAETAERINKAYDDYEQTGLFKLEPDDFLKLIEWQTEIMQLNDRLTLTVNKLYAALLYERTQRNLRHN